MESRGTSATGSQKSWRTVVVSLICGAIVAVAGCGGSDSGQNLSASNRPANVRGVLIQPAVHKPDVTLTDTSGQPFSIAGETRGYLTVLYLGYTHCPDACPTTMADLAAALKSLPPASAARVKVIFVTTDPARDTPAVLRKWLDLFDVAFVGLTGTDEQVQALESELRLPPGEKEDDGNGGYSVSHAAYALAFTANDDIAHTVYPEGFARADLTADLTLLATRGWPNG